MRIGDIAASTAAQTGGVQMVTVDGNGVLGRQPIALAAAGSPSAMLVDSRLGSMQHEMEAMEVRFAQGIAATTAMAPVQIPSAPGRFTYSFNGASYRGAYAAGGSMMYRLNTKAPMAVGLGFAKGNGKSNTVRLGIAGEF